MALWIEAFPEPSGDAGKRLLLAIWNNGDVLWRGVLEPTSADLAQATIPVADASSTVADIRSALRSFEDMPNQGWMLEQSAMVLGFVDEAGRHRVSTFHTMAPDLPTILKTRFNRIVVDPSTRDEIASRFSDEMRFIGVWDTEMRKLRDVLAGAKPAPAVSRVIRWPGPE